MNSKLGKVVHVEGGYTVVELLDERNGQEIVLGFSLYGVGTDIHRIYTREQAIAALRERVYA